MMAAAPRPSSVRRLVAIWEKSKRLASSGGVEANKSSDLKVFSSVATRRARMSGHCASPLLQMTNLNRHTARLLDLIMLNPKYVLKQMNNNKGLLPI